MKIGVRAHDFGRRPPRELAGILRQGGYNAAQVALPKAIEGIDDYEHITLAQLEQTRAAFEDAGVEITVLGCYMDLSDPDDTARAAALENVRRNLGYAVELGAKAVGSETSYLHLSAEEKLARAPLMTDSVCRIVEWAEQAGADFAIEPVEWHPLDRVGRLQALIAAAGHSERLRVIFDAANVLTPPQLASQAAVWQAWLGEFGPRVMALHIKDFVWDAAGAYQPKPLGAGVMDYTAITAWLKAQPREIPLLREETIHACAAEDLAFLRALA